MLDARDHTKPADERSKLAEFERCTRGRQSEAKIALILP
jgi:hypothetical protein